MTCFKQREKCGRGRQRGKNLKGEEREIYGVLLSLSAKLEGVKVERGRKIKRGGGGEGKKGALLLARALINTRPLDRK